MDIHGLAMQVKAPIWTSNISCLCQVLSFS